MTGVVYLELTSLEQEEPLRGHEVSRGEPVEVHTTRETRTLEFHFVMTRFSKYIGIATC